MIGKMKLRDVLDIYAHGDGPLPDEWCKWENIMPNAAYRVKIALCEDETHILTYATHPILIPFYDCPVCCIDVDGEDTLRIWLLHEAYIPKLIEKLKKGNE